ncbi:hypothetical protein BH23ACT9_BH23ACT9_31660 [soil metagenome]
MRRCYGACTPPPRPGPPHLPHVDRIWALRHNLTPYDAAYAALAEALGCALLTGDAAFTTVAALRYPVRTLPS